jgi:Aspartyl protease/Tetratricopeptide repeat
MDFSANKLNYFSQDHCPGKVVYRHAQEIARVPLILKDITRVLVQIKLDGQPFNAVVDTGATRSAISMPVAKNTFGLEPGAPGVIPAGDVNGDPHLASYAHTFSTLTFEGVTVANPRLLLIPDRMGGRAPQKGSHIAGNPNVRLPEMILGMDIMQHLHMYMAFNESKLYVSAAAPSPPDPNADAAAGQSRRLSELDKLLALSLANATLLNDRCHQRSLEKVKLDDALMDCEASLKVRPRSPYVLDSKGFVLYQLGRYQDALNAYDEVLKTEPRLAPSLFMRGQAKQKLGDSAGGATDVAAAKTIDPYFLSAFHGAVSAN